MLARLRGKITFSERARDERMRLHVRRLFEVSDMPAHVLIRKLAVT